MPAGAANAAGKQRGRPFKRGQSGNPAGKRAGTKHRATKLIEDMLGDEMAAIGKKLVEMALGGDPTAMRLAMERIAPVRRGRPVKFSMPSVTNAADVVSAIGAILGAISAGELTPDEGQTVAQCLEVKRRALELAELEQRVAALEQGALR